jgi:STE24 endopeptidase
VLLTGLMLFLFSRIVGNPALSTALGAETPGFHIGLIAFGILYSPLSLIIGLLSNYISRRNEFEADRFVKDNYDSRKLASALKLLSVKNLSNMMPHPAYVFFHYSHPPLLARLEKLE